MGLTLLTVREDPSKDESGLKQPGLRFNSFDNSVRHDKIPPKMMAGCQGTLRAGNTRVRTSSQVELRFLSWKKNK